MTTTIRLTLLTLLISPTLQADDRANLDDDSRRPRLVVLTDIGGDPDDQQSMIRLLVHANEFVIEGLIATASGTPGELKEAVTKPHLIREQIEATRRCFPICESTPRAFRAPSRCWESSSPATRIVVVSSSAKSMTPRARAGSLLVRTKKIRGR